MNSNIPLFNKVEARLARSADTSDAHHASIATRDHEAIRQWGARHRAEPATGEATASGPATVHMRDGGAGIRLNFPGAGRFRPITWDEWFENFERHHLTFVYEDRRSRLRRVGGSRRRSWAGPRRLVRGGAADAGISGAAHESVPDHERRDPQRALLLKRGSSQRPCG